MTKASDNEFPSVLFDEQASDPSTPAAGFWRAFIKSDGLYIIDDTGAVTGPFATASGGSAPDSAEAVLTSPVTIVNANTFYDGPSLSLAAGSYLIEAEADTSSVAATPTGFTIRIYDGTTVHAARLAYNSDNNANGGAHLSCKARVTLGGTTTVKLQVASARGSSDGVILDTAQANGTADKCTRINATTITAV